MLASLFIIMSFFPLFNNIDVVIAESLNDNINQQIDKIDFSELEEFFNSFLVDISGLDFSSNLKKLLNGEYETDLYSVLSYIAKIIFDKVFDFLPAFLSIISIAILCAFIQQVRSSFLTEGVAEISFFVCMMSIILILSAQVISIFENTQIAIENITKLTEIMSPIIITLMIAVGGNVSASVYSPTVAFFSGGIINIVSSIILPLVGVMTIFNLASNFSNSIKLNKFSELFTSVIKWIVGIIVTVYSMFLSVQGITSATFDGVSIKAAKYALSNSIPIIGGFIKDGFDLVVAGSILIKNSVGLLVVFILFLIIVSPVINMAVFSLLLKLTSALIEPISDVRISNFCYSLSKTIAYLIACILIVGLMLFVTVLLMIFSANAFI